MDGSYQHRVEWKRPGTYTHRLTQTFWSLIPSYTTGRRNSLRHQPVECYLCFELAGDALSYLDLFRTAMNRAFGNTVTFYLSYLGGADPGLFIAQKLVKLDA